MAGLMQDKFLLPPGFLPITLVGPDGRSFAVVGDSDPGEYEQWLMTAQPRSEVAWLLSQFLGKHGVLVDIGANIGTVALPLALMGAHVIAIEPLPRNCLKLYFACLVNGTPNLKVLQMAASSADTILHFGGAEAWGHIGGGQAEVVAMRLDTVLEMLRPPNQDWLCAPPVIKIDVEGHELKVLEGAVHFIEQHRPIILFESIEIEGQSRDQHSKLCKRFLESRSYHLFLQRGKILTARTAEQVQEAHVGDVLAVPQERLEILRMLEVRELEPEERVAWVREMAEFPFINHRLHAAGTIVALAREEPVLIPLLAPVEALLAADEDPRVASIVLSMNP